MQPSTTKPVTKVMRSMERKWRHSNEPGYVHRPGPQRVPAGWFFFYGTLKDPKLLARVARLDQEPEMVKAKIEHRKIRYWGKYPTLCHGNEVVQGVAWYCPSPEIAAKICAHERDASCEIAK